MHSIYHGDKEIKFTLTRKNVKNINLRINADMEVSVSANHYVPLDYIMDFVGSKAEWINKRLDYYKNTVKVKDDKKEYVDGEFYSYLGSQYKLKVFKGEIEEVKYFKGSIHIYTKDISNFKKKEKLMENWYRLRCEIIFKESLDRMHGLVKVYNIEYPILAIRKMKSRWGTCYTNKNKIILNRALIKAPKACIDYVVLHELIHFKHKNHGNGFYSLLDILMPDWKDRRKMLRGVNSF